MRPWTPDKITIVRDERVLVMSPKRDCNRCATRLGDLTDHETVIAGRPGRRLPAVHGECPVCLGFHAVLATPAAPLEPDADTVSLQYQLLCPGTPAGMSVAPCAAWDRCGCVPGPAVEVPSLEWVLFLARPCPTSATKEHRHLLDRDEPGEPYVGHPVAGVCGYRDKVKQLAASRGSGTYSDYLGQLVADVVTGPGLYPVEIEEPDLSFSPESLVFEPCDIAPHQAAEPVPL